MAAGAPRQGDPATNDGDGRMSGYAVDFRRRFGLKRGIERHNYLIYNTHARFIASLEFSGRVVDLGCGNAPYREHVLTTAREYVGVDREDTRYDGRNAT